MKTFSLAIFLTAGLLLAPTPRLAAVCQDPPWNPGGEGKPTPKPSPTPAKPNK